MKKLYLFDFDGTLTKKDSMFLFLKFYNKTLYRIQYIRHLPLFVLLKMNLSEAEKIKKSFIASILRHDSEEKIRKKAQQFFEKEYPELIRETALDFINNREKNTVSYLVTASLDIWVRPFAEQFNMKLIATEAEFVNGKFTGNFATKNCNGKQKVVRIKKAMGKEKFDKIIAFGDSEGDKQMLEFADEAHFNFFH